MPRTTLRATNVYDHYQWRLGMTCYYCSVLYRCSNNFEMLRYHNLSTDPNPDQICKRRFMCQSQPKLLAIPTYFIVSYHHAFMSWSRSPSSSVRSFRQKQLLSDGDYATTLLPPPIFHLNLLRLAVLLTASRPQLPSAILEPFKPAMTSCLPTSLPIT
jgi:hypothetical protein